MPGPSPASHPSGAFGSGGRARQAVKLSPQADARPTPLTDNSTGYGQRLQRGAKAGEKIGSIRGLVARSGTVWPSFRTWRGVQPQNVLFCSRSGRPAHPGCALKPLCFRTYLSDIRLGHTPQPRDMSEPDVRNTG